MATSAHFASLPRLEESVPPCPWVQIFWHHYLLLRPLVPTGQAIAGNETPAWAPGSPTLDVHFHFLPFSSCHSSITAVKCRGQPPIATQQLDVHSRFGPAGRGPFVFRMREVILNTHSFWVIAFSFISQCARGCVFVVVFFLLVPLLINGFCIYFLILIRDIYREHCHV